MKICIYYIATDVYKKNFDAFINSLDNFFPEYSKDIIYICDELSLNGTITKYNDKINIKHIYITHNPWPIITLFKMYYIDNNKVKGYDAYFYFNGNCIVYPMNNKVKTDFINAISANKLILSFHNFNVPKPYNEKIEMFKTNNELGINAGFFGGNYDVFFKMCNWVSMRVQEHLYKRKIPWWHDESVLKEYIIENIDRKNLSDIWLDQYLFHPYVKYKPEESHFLYLSKTEKVKKTL